MDNDIIKQFEARADIIKSMAHPSRLIIVDELSRGSKCVGELTQLIGADTSTISRHLAILKTAGIISDKKQGANVYYSLQCVCILSFFGCVETILKLKAEEQLSLTQ